MIIYNFREAFAAAKPPVVPYLGLFRRSLLTIEETEPLFLDNGEIFIHVCFCFRLFCFVVLFLFC